MIRDKFGPDSVACTGGFAAAMFCSMECISDSRPGASALAKFLDSPDAGYCLDASPIMPAGATVWNEFSDRPGSLFAVRGV